MDVKFLQLLANTQTIAQNPFVPYSFQYEYPHLYNQIALTLTFHSKARHLCWSFLGKSFVSIGNFFFEKRNTNA